MSDEWPEYIAAKPDKTWANMPHGQTYVHIRRHMLISGNLDDAKKRITDLEAQLAKRDAAVAAADDLADVMDRPVQSCSETGRYHYNWEKVDDTITAYRKARGQDETAKG